MTQDETRELKRMVIAASNYYERQLSDDAVRMYVLDMQDLDFNEVVIAMTSYRKNAMNIRMFLPAHIRDLITPKINSIDLARETAVRIREAIRNFGWPGEKEAQLFLGNSAWRVVRRFGGWGHLCENLGTKIQEGQFMAQVRDAVESNIKLERAGINTELPVLEQVDNGKMGSVLRLINGIKALNPGENV